MSAPYRQSPPCIHGESKPSARLARVMARSLGSRPAGSGPSAARESLATSLFPGYHLHHDGTDPLTGWQMRHNSS
jgi:hypothetical protein